MQSLTRRFFGRHDQRGPDGWLAWEGPFHAGCAAPRTVREHDQHFASHGARAEHDGRVYVVGGLTPWHLLCGTDHLLVSDELGEVLARRCPGQGELLRAEVLDVPSGRRLTGYSELRLREEITRDDILRIKNPLPRMWRYQAGGSHLFVTRPVMHAIQEARIVGLQYWPGLASFFGGTTAGIDTGYVATGSGGRPSSPM